MSYDAKQVDQLLQQMAASAERVAELRRKFDAALDAKEKQAA